MLKFTNNASATLAGSITGSSTTAILTAGNGSLFPALGENEYFFATLVDSSNNLEVIKVTARSADTLTIVRGQDGTVARPYATGDKVELRLVAAVFQELIQRDGTVDFTGQITVPQGTAAGKAINASRQILTSSNLTGGGDLTTDRTLDLSNTGVTAGTKGSATEIPVVAVDAKGRVTSLTGVALDLSTKANTGGSNATGTWPISISGNAATAPWSGISGRPTALSSFTNDSSFVNSTSGTVNCQKLYGNVNNCNCYDGLYYNSQNRYSTERTGTAMRLIGANCNCHCDCCCCFAAGTLVQMADGSVKAIEQVGIGEKIAGLAGDVTVAHKFDTTLKSNSLFKVNDSITVTGGHLFATDSGWAALDMSVYPHGVFFRAEQTIEGGELVDIKHQSERPESVRQLVVGDHVNGVEIKSIERVDADPDFGVHNMIVDGGDGFILADGYAVDGFMRQTCGVCK